MTTPFECPGCGAKQVGAYVLHNTDCPAFGAVLRETYCRHWPLNVGRPRHERGQAHRNRPDPHLWVTQALADGLRQAGITAGHMRGITIHY